MSNPIRIAINGASGRMGSALQTLLPQDTRFEQVMRVDSPDDWRDGPAVDVVIDFSAPAGFDAALTYCAAHDAALVSGTTGLGEAQRRAMDEAVRTIPILHASNFSLAIAVLARILREAARALPNWDLEIVEMHHARKVDAPSGTALALGRAAAAARGLDFDSVAVRSRAGHTGARPTGAIGFASIRAGDVVGEHSAILAGVGERLELTHRATDRAIFARGALAADAWLSGRAPGRYSIDDVLA
jgi:4-hydroxy-tetrahydrodipicolinate reductase